MIMKFVIYYSQLQDKKYGFSGKGHLTQTDRWECFRAFECGIVLIEKEEEE